MKIFLGKKNRKIVRTREKDGNAEKKPYRLPFKKQKKTHLIKPT